MKLELIYESYKTCGSAKTSRLLPFIQQNSMKIDRFGHDDGICPGIKIISIEKLDRWALRATLNGILIFTQMYIV